MSPRLLVAMRTPSSSAGELHVAWQHAAVALPCACQIRDVVQLRVHISCTLHALQLAGRVATQNIRLSKGKVQHSTAQQYVSPSLL